MVQIFSEPTAPNFAIEVMSIFFGEFNMDFAAHNLEGKAKQFAVIPISLLLDFVPALVIEVVEDGIVGINPVRTIPNPDNALLQVANKPVWSGIVEFLLNAIDGVEEVGLVCLNEMDVVQKFIPDAIRRDVEGVGRIAPSSDSANRVHFLFLSFMLPLYQTINRSQENERGVSK